MIRAFTKQLLNLFYMVKFEVYLTPRHFIADLHPGYKNNKRIILVGIESYRYDYEWTFNQELLISKCVCSFSAGP